MGHPIKPPNSDWLSDSWCSPQVAERKETALNLKLQPSWSVVQTAAVPSAAVWFCHTCRKAPHSWFDFEPFLRMNLFIVTVLKTRMQNDDRNDFYGENIPKESHRAAFDNLKLEDKQMKHAGSSWFSDSSHGCDFADCINTLWAWKRLHPALRSHLLRFGCTGDDWGKLLMLNVMFFSDGKQIGSVAVG